MGHYEESKRMIQLLYHQSQQAIHHFDITSVISMLHHQLVIFTCPNEYLIRGVIIFYETVILLISIPIKNPSVISCSHQLVIITARNEYSIFDTIYLCDTHYIRSQYSYLSWLEQS